MNNIEDSITEPAGMTCSSQIKTRSRGIFFGDSPFKLSTQVLFFQISISSLCMEFLQFLLAPLGQTAFTAQMMGGIILGPSVLGRSRAFSKNIFPDSGLYFSHTFALFGCMIFLFLVGVKMDVHMIRKSGRRGVAIGLCNFFLPMIIAVALAHTFKTTRTLDPMVSNSIYCVAVLLNLSSSHVVACLLAELKILNSELGRLAISSSMLSGLCSWSLAVTTYVIIQGTKGQQDDMLTQALSFLSLMLIIIYLMRPIIHWIVKQEIRRKTVKESHIFSVFLMILCSAFLGEIMGQHFLVGPVILGILVPDGPPLGSALLDKLESYTSCILLPIFFVVNLSRANFYIIQPKNLETLAVIALGAFAGKTVGSMLPAMYYKMPIDDALSLGLVMSSQGITELILLGRALQLGYIDDQSYSIMIFCMLLFTAVISPLVRKLYKPRKYNSIKRRTILHARPESELRLLACIYHEDNTPSIINLLEVSNPSFEHPICFYVIHLVDLKGRTTSVLVTHRPGKKQSAYSTHSQHIINAFRLYEQQNQGTVHVTPFTSIAPHETIHVDVCELAVEKRVAMVLVPFHEHWNNMGVAREQAGIIRTVNKNILKYSPCSVGILVDRGTLPNNTLLYASRTLYRIGMLFIGGPDDREALAYAMRMAEHPNVSLTVLHFIESSSKDKKHHQRGIDFELINEFRMSNVGSKRLVYKEQVIADSLGIISVVQALDNSYELMLLGKSHENETMMFGGFTEWNEFPELGFLGDMLASSDSKCKASLLVVQQQAVVGDDNLMEPSPLIQGDAFSVVDIDKTWSLS